MNRLKGNQSSYVLAALLAIFIVFDISVPDPVAELVDTIVGKLVVILVALNLFFLHPIVGALGLVAAYELIRRAERAPPSMARKYLPSEKKKSVELSKINQFPLTVEEEVIANQIPYAFNTETATAAPYRPVQDPVFDAARV